MGAALLMAIALSLDGFGVGLAYGLRRIRLPFGSLGVIALCSALAMGISMLFGHWVVIWLKVIPARFIGGAILMTLGTVQLVRAVRSARNRQVLPETVPAMTMPALVPNFEPEPLLRIQLRFLGLVIQVLRTPDIADVDGSGGISVRESFLLGCALAMDAFASGIGAAMAGMNLSVIGVVALTQIAMIRTGQLLAGRIPASWMEKAELMPGAVLIIVGLGKIL